MSAAAAAETDLPPEPDRLGDAPHPRHTARLHGQQAAERAFLEAFNSGRLHHGWLITGPRGVGKATLAWRIARFLLSRPVPSGPDAQGRGAAAPGLFGSGDLPETPPPGSPAGVDAGDAAGAQGLDLAPDHPIARRVAALSEPRLFLLRRGWDAQRKALRREITVDEVRRLNGFFQLSAADGGRRVVVVDCADDLNTNAANALLKLLEEPPENATLLLVSHQPSALLPTIRSRCRILRCQPLGPDDLERAMSDAGMGETGREGAALAELAGGSVGAAIRLSGQDGLKAYREIVTLMQSLPGLDRPAALRLAESAAGAQRAERFDLLLELLDLFLARLARTGISGPPLVEAAPGEAALMQRLCPDAAAARLWAGLQQELGARARQGRAVNLDPAALLLDMILRIAEAATGQPPR